MSGDIEARKKLLAERKKEKRKKPEFIRQESWRYKRLKENWRRPRGLDNKMRRRVKGWPSCPSSGYRGPKKARGLHPSAFREVLIFNMDDLNKVNPELEAIRIASSVGDRKRVELVKEARERGIHILNPREFRELEELVTEESS